MRIATLSAILHTLIVKRRARFKIALALPAMISFVLLTNPFEDACAADQIPSVVALLTIVAYVARPMYAIWVPLFVAFVADTLTAAFVPGLNTFQRVFFVLLGLVPTWVLWLTRPRQLTTET
jgi:hypothetical protein